MAPYRNPGGPDCALTDCRRAGSTRTAATSTKMYCDDNGDMVADTPKDAKELKTPGIAGLRTSPGRGPGRLREDLQAFHRLPWRVHRQARGLHLRRATPPRSRPCARASLHVGSFSTGPTAFAVNIAGARCRSRSRATKGLPGLQPDRGRQEGQPVPEAHRPEGQARGHPRPRQLRPHGADGAVPEGGLVPRRTTRSVLEASDQSILGVNSATTTRRRWPRTCSTARPCAARSGRELPRHLHQPKFPPPRRSPTAHDLEPAFRDQDGQVLHDYRCG